MPMFVCERVLFYHYLTAGVDQLVPGYTVTVVTNLGKGGPYVISL